MNSLSRFEDEASKDWKLTKEQLKKTKLKDFEIEYLEDFFMDLEELLVKEIANYAMVKTYPLVDEESRLLFRVFVFSRGVNEYRAAISIDDEHNAVYVYPDPSTKTNLVNQINTLTDKLIKRYELKYKTKNSNLLKPSKFHSLIQKLVQNKKR